MSTDASRDTSSFVEQLRFIHLTLVAGCLIAIVAITSESSSSPARAYEETTQLMEIATRSRSKSDQGLEGILRRQKEAMVGRHRLNEENKIFVASNEKPPQIIAFDLSRDNFGLPLHLWRLATDPNVTSEKAKSIGVRFAPNLTLGDDPSPSAGESDHKTLDQLRSLWNRLSLYRYLILREGVYGGWRVDNNGAIVEVRRDPDGDEKAAIAFTTGVLGRQELLLHADLLDLLSKSPADISRLSKRDEAARKLISSKDDKCYLVFENGLYLFILNADCVADEFDIQALLTKGMQTPPRPGSFSYSFPAINELAKDLGALPLTNLSAVFLSEKNRSKDKVELIGAKLPGESVSKWGIVILLSIAFYFYATFRDFVRRAARADKAWTIAWVGSSSEALSQANFLVTMLIFPMTIGFLAWRGALEFDLKSSFMYGGAVVIAIALAVGLLSCWRQALRICTTDSESAA